MALFKSAVILKNKTLLLSQANEEVKQKVTVGVASRLDFINTGSFDAKHVLSATQL